MIIRLPAKQVKRFRASNLSRDQLIMAGNGLLILGMNNRSLCEGADLTPRQAQLLRSGALLPAYRIH